MSATSLAGIRLPIRVGGVLMVHASLRSLSGTGADADDVIAWLLDHLGADGTLAMPTLTYAATVQAGMRFDVRSTPSDVGALSERFRHHAGVMRSLHPTHSVASAGARAWELVRHHGLDREPCGPNSPFSLLPRLDGQILMLGCPLSANTTMHAVESVIPPPFLHAPEPRRYQVTDHHGDTTIAIHRYHGFVHYGKRQRYDRLWDKLPPERRWAGGFGRCAWHLMDAQAVFAAGLAAIAADPLAFADPDPGAGGAQSKTSAPDRPT